MSEGRVVRRRLPNGLRVVCVPQPHLNVSEVSCYVGVGSRHEIPEQSGISHFLEHMLFRGTDDYPTSFELENAFELFGGGANAATDAESTCYFSRFHPNHLDEGISLFASMLQRPLLSDIEIERRIILEEAQEDFSETGEEINPDALMARLLWPGTPLEWPTIGRRESLAAIDRNALYQHFERFYTPSNTVIAVAGRADPDRVISAAEAHFARWRGAERESTAPVRGVGSGPKSRWVRDSASQVTVQLAFPVPGRTSEHAVRLRIVRRLLSGGVTSRLMLRLRETLGLTYNIEASLTQFEETGALVVEFLVTPENVVEGVREVLQVFRELRHDPVPPEEFARVVRTYLFDLDFSLDMPDEMVSRYGWGELVGHVREIETDRREIGQVTIPELTETIASCLDPRQLRLVVVGPFRPADRRTIDAILAGAPEAFS